ncbi:choline dehydrogenase-like flavoprotein [Labrenzia sp. EL_208]|uniref:6'''-hydroxyparomomycin C oxidase n=1 Tax=Roseibium album TaxID=311410 RepID=A0A0M7A5G5_9HYPH|nr:GMC family oxidoreductase [Roseibium album]MBG6160235.1 choline dehydrogenase-like flavoprotein [Labrenzia sp. EL_162]MBG6166330.1 choline dehydrogenase-like flavoprotein [Labrenzia sp. EL_195]MBG6178455.1 choline dehydrogenase-like flavoprotein [Labrenzia sp. EL_132]MBG6198767.1 choline dehydrogenase-like flavoprotein [Labrenzia sp. EL_159]MBG6233078.1 choline dehydrogenase-like flavoprotein [Labrenzia sp. EL_208]
MTNEPVDVLIIGAGASGAAIAWSLLETRMRILCLEQGEHLQDRDFPSRREDYELSRYGEFSCDPNVRKLKQDYPVNSQNSCITPVNWNGVGGSTINFLGHWPRMKPSDFRTRSLDGVAEDWPVDYATLEPFYDLNDENTGVSGLGGNPGYPDYSPPLPPIPIGKLGQTLAKGFNELGWHWWPSDVAILSQDRDGRQKCVNAGTCDLGCAAGAKGGTNFTYWPVLENAGVELRTRSRVREILIDQETGFATGVLYHGADGQLHEQKAELVVVACNGVGTPRLLLNSKSQLFPDGLANRSGLVGKNLMFHPLTGVAGVFDEPMLGHEGPMACSILSQEFYETDRSRDFVRGYGLHSGRSTTPMTYALGGYGIDNPIPWGAEHREIMDTVYPYLAGLTVVSEDLPEEINCVTLDPELTDSDGIPAPKINYRLGENTRRMLRHGEEKATELLLAAGAKRVLAKGDDKVWWRAGWHQMGTCRMGDDPEKSVVNGWGRSHDVKNLFIVDGSIFVTSGAVNPTSTIQALALYIGDRIKTNIANLFD